MNTSRTAGRTARRLSSPSVGLLLLLLGGAVLFSSPQTALADDDSCPSPGGVLHTFVHHQITGFTQQTAMSQPVLSRNGNRIAFTDAPGTGDAAQPNKIYAINADGSGQQLVDSYKSLCFCGSAVDISDDGSKVVSSDAVQLRIANGDGSGAKPLITLDGNEINALKISGDGTKVFFRIYRDTGNSTSGTSVPIQSGLWVINADGSGLRQVAGPDGLAGAVGQTAAEYPHFIFSGSSMNAGIDVSRDGSRIIFGSNDHPISGGAGQAVFVVNLDGSGLKKLSERVAYLYNVALSLDGSKAAYNEYPITEGTVGTGEIRVLNFDGSGQKSLGQIPSHQTLQLNSDGSKLLTGEAGYLYDTATGVVTQLAALTPGSGGQTSVLYDGLFGATMNASGNKFAYQMSFTRCADCANQGIQLAVMLIDPSERGEAPEVSEMSVDPPYVQGDIGSNATAKVHITTGNKLEAVGIGFFRNGLWDINLRGVGPLFDDGTNGDAATGDGIFTNSKLYHSYVILRDNDKDQDIGPRTVRFQSEVRSTDGRLHATAVEYEPFAVVKTLPIPTLIQVHPRQANQGATLSNSAITGTNLAGATGIAFLLNGQPDGKVTATDLVVENNGYLRFSLSVAVDAAPGERVVQVIRPGGTSSADKTPANTLTVVAGGGLSGDLNGDGKVTVSDAILVLRKAVGLD